MREQWTHKFLHSHLKCCWDIVVFAAKTLHGVLNQTFVCRHSNTFTELKVSREFSNLFFKAGTMLVCDWMWYFTHLNWTGGVHCLCLGGPIVWSRLMGDTWRTEYFHLLLKIVLQMTFCWKLSYRWNTAVIGKNVVKNFTPKNGTAWT